MSFEVKDSPQYRYENDVEYKLLVDTLTHFIMEAKFTPSELREASLLAAIHYEMIHVRRYYTVPTKVNQAIKTLSDWRKKNGLDSR